MDEEGREEAAEPWDAAETLEGQRSKPPSSHQATSVLHTPPGVYKHRPQHACAHLQGDSHGRRWGRWHSEPSWPVYLSPGATGKAFQNQQRVF